MSAALKPGWAMSEDQHSHFWNLWSVASRYQGWTGSEPELRRREILSELGFSSAKQIDHRDGFDRVKKRLLELCGKVANEPVDAGQRRRILARIGESIAELEDAGCPSHTLNTVLRQRFKIVEGVNTMADLDTPELLNLLRTVTRLLHPPKKRRKRAQASDSHTLCNVTADNLPLSCMESADPFFQAG
jgi:hypothetical protein